MINKEPISIMEHSSTQHNYMMQAKLVTSMNTLQIPFAFKKAPGKQQKTIFKNPIKHTYKNLLHKKQHNRPNR